MFSVFFLIVKRLRRRPAFFFILPLSLEERIFRNVCLNFAVIFVVVDRAFDEEEKDDEDDEDDESETLVLVLFVSRSASRIIFGRSSSFPSGRLFLHA